MSQLPKCIRINPSERIQPYSLINHDQSSNHPTPRLLQPILDLFCGPRMLRVCIHQNIQNALLLPGIRELVPAHRYSHARCVHGGRGASVGYSDAAKAFYDLVYFGLARQLVIYGAWQGDH